MALLGDFKHARVMRSLLYGLEMFEPIHSSPTSADTKVIEETKEKLGTRIRVRKHKPDGFDVLYVCRYKRSASLTASRAPAIFRLTESMPRVLQRHLR